MKNIYYFPFRFVPYIFIYFVNSIDFADVRVFVKKIIATVFYILSRKGTAILQ